MAEAPRNTHLPSGYDEEFVCEVDDDFLCLICHLPLREPVLTRCGHRFCNACLEEHLRRQEVQNQPYTCPADRKGLDRDRDVFPDNATGRKILSMAIKCPSDGCSWTGELRNKEAHLEDCSFKIVTCTSENCHVNVKRKDLEQHVTDTCEWRIIECEFCEDLHPKRHLQIPNHTENDCPVTLVSCPYAQMGCTEKFQRKNVDSHRQSAMGEHLDLACVKLNNTQVQLDETRAQLSRLTQDQLINNQESRETTRKLEEKLGALQRQIDTKVITDKDGSNTRFIWKITFFSESLRQAKEGVKERIESDPFYTGCYGYKLKVVVYPYHTGTSRLLRSPHLSLGIVLMEGEYDDMLPWPFSKKITFTIIDQNKDLKERQNHTDYLSPSKRKLSPQLNIFSQRPEGKTIEVKSKIPLVITHLKLQTRRYIVNDTLFLQVDVEPDD